jgi:Cu+-exporting ATPase
MLREAHCDVLDFGDGQPKPDDDYPDFVGPEASAGKLQEGKTVVFVAIDGKPAGIVAVAGPIKSTTVEAIGELHALGLQIVMLTGDNCRTAHAVAEQLGLDEVAAEIEPAGKVAPVKKMRGDGKHSCDGRRRHQRRTRPQRG